MEEKLFTLIRFLESLISVKCSKWLFSVWRVNSQNGAQETIYEPKDKLY